MLLREESDLGKISIYGQISPCLNAGKIQGHGQKQSRYRRFFTTIENGRCSFFIGDLLVSFKNLNQRSLSMISFYQALRKGCSFVFKRASLLSYSMLLLLFCMVAQTCIAQEDPNVAGPSGNIITGYKGMLKYAEAGIFIFLQYVTSAVLYGRADMCRAERS